MVSGLGGEASRRHWMKKRSGKTVTVKVLKVSLKAGSKGEREGERCSQV